MQQCSEQGGFGMDAPCHPSPLASEHNRRDLILGLGVDRRDKRHETWRSCPVEGNTEQAMVVKCNVKNNRDNLEKSQLLVFWIASPRKRRAFNDKWAPPVDEKIQDYNSRLRWAPREKFRGQASVAESSSCDWNLQVVRDRTAPSPIHEPYFGGADDAPARQM
ncbi:hypothetical protein N7539_008416 [Penicillium diatomitis]|uniref:Uncharacterized protein n=1 Tax=Penicillium diatomitis TaxID=2819901 RepID=A0A9W9WTQ4_9EURO|nr:uncharacterized protein N7539_008416 [Penicillium diatomitis]KAJ5475350.1 hypothetical protein N7539_008416 [Penicillium diatomitis]